MAKKTPLRKCIACQDRKEKRDLIRIVNHPEDGVKIDTRGKANGRGAYLCKKEECIDKAQDKNLLKSALKTSIDDEIYEEIKRYVED